MEEKEVMLGVPEDAENGIELTEHRAIVTVPEDSVEINIIAKVFHDGEIVKVSKVMSMGDIRTAFRKADEGYIDDDDRFVLTDKGLKYMEGLNDW